MNQPPGLQIDLLKCSADTRRWVLTALDSLESENKALRAENNALRAKLGMGWDDLSKRGRSMRSLLLLAVLLAGCEPVCSPKPLRFECELHRNDGLSLAILSVSVRVLPGAPDIECRSEWRGNRLYVLCYEGEKVTLYADGCDPVSFVVSEKERTKR